MAWSEFNPIPPFTEQEAAKFWTRVKRGSAQECWPYVATRTRKYGFFYFRRKAYRAHRIAYFLSTGIDPGDKMVCHHCDFGLCCNPAHHFLGTHQDNQADKIAKGRGNTGNRHRSKTRPESVARGEEHWIAKLTEDAVREIRRCHDMGESFSSLAKRFGVEICPVYMAYHRKTWRHVE